MKLVSLSRTLWGQVGQVGRGAEKHAPAQAAAPLGPWAGRREEGEGDSRQPGPPSPATFPNVAAPPCSPKFRILPVHCLAQEVSAQLAPMMPQLILEVCGV